MACFVRKAAEKQAQLERSLREKSAVEKELQKVRHELVFENDVLFSEWHKET